MRFLFMRNLYRGLPRPLVFICLFAHFTGLDKRQAETMANRPMTFGLVAAITLVMLILIGVAGKNVGRNTEQLKTESLAASVSQNPWEVVRHR
jgi:hypothetical protein